MKSVKLSNDNYFDIERIIRKVAEDNNIKDISKINIHLSKEEGVVKFAIIDDWGDVPEDFEENKEEVESAGPKYTIYYHNGIEMNGRGIEYIIDKEDGDKWSPDQGLEGIIEDLSSTHPEFYDYELHLYINGGMMGYSMDVDYNPDTTPDEVVDKINDWLHQNVTFEKIGGEE